VDGAHHEPWHAGLVLDDLIPGAIAKELAGNGLGRWPTGDDSRLRFQQGLGPSARSCPEHSEGDEDQRTDRHADQQAGEKGSNVQGGGGS
jgi:hypothetical protein